MRLELRSGTSPLPASRCKPLVTPDAAYWGYPASQPPYSLPGNHPGPGGMSIFELGPANYPYKGAVWAWWDPNTGRRYLEYGWLEQGYGFAING